MKTIAFAAAAALAFAAPAHAFPQWIPVSEASEVTDRGYANYNSVRGTGSIRSVDTSIWHKHYGRLTATVHVNCKDWQVSVTAEGVTTQWRPIGMGSGNEGIAYLICPGAKRSVSEASL